MSDDRHYVSGFFANRESAMMVAAKLLDWGLPSDRVHVFEKDSSRLDEPSKPQSGDVLADVAVDGAIGATVGAGVGAIGQFVLTAANVSLFVASPLIAPLAMLGWGATLGGLIGAAAGAQKDSEKFSALARDAVASGQVVLLADTRSAAETIFAEETIEAAVGAYKEKTVS
ncbi:hypothetical protein J5J83_05210 [Azoarcus sp. L1K30]|uniref:hypothetical protein n=1 Tax=Azoarcus sp. L1K30 TaxID=2820277 RepID=UPI001B827F88|nr:hypothetical protein [Azoarcus sp. L1K30]MBR0565516.1 hypothetical protein [Azoarcus sp. L1K30]